MDANEDEYETKVREIVEDLLYHTLRRNPKNIVSYF